MARLTQRVTLM